MLWDCWRSFLFWGLSYDLRSQGSRFFEPTRFFGTRLWFSQRICWDYRWANRLSCSLSIFLECGIKEKINMDSSGVSWSWNISEYIFSCCGNMCFCEYMQLYTISIISHVSKSIWKDRVSDFCRGKEVISIYGRLWWMNLWSSPIRYFYLLRRYWDSLFPKEFSIKDNNVY